MKPKITFWGKIPFSWITPHGHINSSSNSTALRHKQYAFIFLEEGEEEGRPGVDSIKAFTYYPRLLAPGPDPPLRCLPAPQRDETYFVAPLAQAPSKASTGALVLS